MCPRFSFVITLTVINKFNDSRVPRDSCKKYKLFFLKWTLSLTLPILNDFHVKLTLVLLYDLKLKNGMTFLSVFTKKTMQDVNCKQVDQLAKLKNRTCSTVIISFKVAEF